MHKHYYVNKETIGNPHYNHEVHTKDCQWMPSAANRDYLGYYNNCAAAVKKAEEIYANVDGCATCCPLCHKG